MIENRGERIGFRPLVLYVVTHELIHIIRFGTFLKSYEVLSGKDEEETRVHKVTGQVLKNVRMRGLDQVLDSYRVCNSA